MNDFKKMPKMACGGGVKKMSEGGDIVSEARKATKTFNAIDMPSRFGSLNKKTTQSVEMPSRFGSSAPRTRKIDGEDVPVNSTPTKTRGNLELLKKGGKVKRGNKK